VSSIFNNKKIPTKGNWETEKTMIKVTYQIPDMHCSNCPMHLEAIEDDLPGIQRIKASYQKGTLVVEFDESLVSEEQIKAAVYEAGYTIA
jgi:copper chaperone CopZ